MPNEIEKYQSENSQQRPSQYNEVDLRRGFWYHFYRKPRKFFTVISILKVAALVFFGFGTLGLIPKEVGSYIVALLVFLVSYLHFKEHEQKLSKYGYWIGVTVII